MEALLIMKMANLWSEWERSFAIWDRLTAAIVCVVFERCLPAPIVELWQGFIRS
jgi:hypothetical protein